MIDFFVCREEENETNRFSIIFWMKLFLCYTFPQSSRFKLIFFCVCWDQRKAVYVALLHAYYNKYFYVGCFFGAFFWYSFKKIYWVHFWVYYKWWLCLRPLGTVECVGLRLKWKILNGRVFKSFWRKIIVRERKKLGNFTWNIQSDRTRVNCI